MKRFFRTLVFVVVAALSAVSISSCGKDDDDNKSEQISDVTPDDFYNELSINKFHSILIDTRNDAKYEKAHVVYRSPSGEPILEAISLSLMYIENGDISKEIEEMDPKHEKFIFITDEGSSPSILKVCDKLSSMGWGKDKIFLLSCSTEEFLKQYPDLDSSYMEDDYMEDDNNKPNEISAIRSDAFYNILIDNVKSAILIDTRYAAKYNKAHIVYKQDGETIIEAISMPLEDEIFYVSGSDHQFYKDVEKLDPNHENFILVTDEGASSLTLKVTGVLSGMGWGKEKIYLLSCSTEEFLKQYPDLDSSYMEDDNNKPNEFDSNRPHGAPVDQISDASSDAFYRGFTNNESKSIVIDTRSAKEYAAGHVRGAISYPLVNDDAFYYDDDPIYSLVETLDPNHENFILITDNGVSTLMLHVAGRISAMGWGKTKVYLLMDKTADFLKKYPDVKE